MRAAADHKRDHRRLLERQGAHQLRMPDRGQQANERAPRVTYEMGGRASYFGQKRSEIIDVNRHLVIGAIRDVLVGPRIPAAVADRAVRLTDRRELLLPGAKITLAAVDEHDWLTLTQLSVSKRRTADADARDPLELVPLHRSLRPDKLTRKGA
ncbi:MAG: hypothetical protein NVSMB25_16050 [Thermoleophilaceae bacterium]